MLWLIYGMVALQSLLDVAMFRVLYRLYKRADVWEAAITMRIDQIIKARQDQTAAEEAQALLRSYGIPGRTSRPFVPSRPLAARTTFPPDPWAEWQQNGHAAEWNG